MLLLGILILVLAIPLASVYLSAILIHRMAFLILLYAGLLSMFATSIMSIDSGIGIFGGLFQITLLSQSFDAFIFLVASIIILLGETLSNNNSNLAINTNTNTNSSFFTNSNGLINTVDTAGNSRSIKLDSNTKLASLTNYPFVILFTTLGMSTLISSNDLVTMFLGIELQSLALYILATMYRDSESATSAGLKYFLLGALSSAIILLGSSLIYAYSGLTNFESLYILASSLITSEGDIFGLGGIGLGALILIIGLLFKIAAAPLHNWAPDVYDGVPTYVTTWLAVMPKVSILLFMAEFTQIIIYNFSGVNILLLLSAFLSLTVGTTVGLAQYKIKRLLAYSTISHVGFMLLALAMNSASGIESFLFYIVQYTLTSVNLFQLILAFGYLIQSHSNNNKLSIYSPVQLISQFKGQFLLNPLLSICLVLSLFSMAGIPPLIGFFGKQMVLYATVHNGYFFLALVAILTSVISAVYYLKVIKVLYSDQDTNTLSQLNNNNTSSNLVISDVHAFVISTISLFILTYILNPTPILNSIHLIALYFYYW